MRRAWPIVAIWIGACAPTQVGDSAGSASPASSEAAVAIAPAVVDAATPAPDAAAAPEPPPACIPNNEPGWTCPEVTLAADGERVAICFHERCGGYLETGCMLVDARTGRSVGPATWPIAHTSAPAPPSPFEVRSEGRSFEVCRDGACRRLRDVLPASASPGDGIETAVNAQGTQLFVLYADGHGEFGSTYNVATGKRIARVELKLPEGPPPPGSSKQIAFHGRGLLLGDFEEPGTIERALDPMTGRLRWLDKPWARLPGDLVVHFSGRGEVELIDFDANLAIIAQRKVGRPHRPAEGVRAELVQVGADALVVTVDPPATLLVDGKARTISRPRPLPMCREPARP